MISFPERSGFFGSSPRTDEPKLMTMTKEVRIGRKPCHDVNMLRLRGTLTAHEIDCMVLARGRLMLLKILDFGVRRGLYLKTRRLGERSVTQQLASARMCWVTLRSPSLRMRRFDVLRWFRELIHSIANCNTSESRHLIRVKLREIDGNPCGRRSEGSQDGE